MTQEQTAPTTLDDDLRSAVEQAASLLARSSYTVVLGGAGMSKESGIPTYRGEGGLWTIKGEPPMNSYDIFSEDPGLWWERRLEAAEHPDDFSLAIAAAEPNDGHRALVELEAMGIVRHLITQNVDDLHRKAGHRSLSEIHGNRQWLRCIRCNARWSRDEFRVNIDLLPPRCAVDGCGGIVKSDTVMFGEPIPRDVLARCSEETYQADCFMTIGTSAVVYPAAQYPLEAAQRGIPLIEVNPDETPLTPFARVAVRAPSGVAIPAIVDAVRVLREQDEASQGERA